MRLHHPIHQLGSNPTWQLHFHTFFTILWLVSMVGVVFLPTFRGGANLPALLIMEVSLWANLATHFGAMSAALAAGANQPKEIPPHEEIG